ncbi:MAG: hypothetical protein RLZZ618_3965 [Pseudomonadota bacterium]|jgi:hypothetical protein
MRKPTSLGKWLALIGVSLVVGYAAVVVVVNVFFTTRLMHLQIYSTNKSQPSLWHFKPLSAAFFRHTGNFCDGESSEEVVRGKNWTLHVLIQMLSEPEKDLGVVWKDFDEAVKRCPIDAVAPGQPLTHLQTAILMAPAEAVRRLLAAGARTEVRVNSPGKKIHGLDAVGLATTLRDRTSGPESRSRYTEIIALLQPVR